MFHTADQILRFVLEVLIGKVRFHVNKYTNER